jgi:hypothetical protein
MGGERSVMYHFRIQLEGRGFFFFLPYKKYKQIFHHLRVKEILNSILPSLKPNLVFWIFFNRRELGFIGTLTTPIQCLFKNVSLREFQQSVIP